MHHFLSLIAETAHAQRSVTLTTGIRIPLVQVFSNLYAFLAVTGVGLCTLIFVAGAATMVVSHGDQTKVDNGKKMMIGSVIGVAIIMGSYGILRTVFFFLYV